MKRTIRCKMVPTPTMAEALAETCKTFASACNSILTEAIATDTVNNIQLHKLAYRRIRKEFGLSANLVVRAIRRVSAAMTAAKHRGRKPTLFRPTSIDYDARIFDYREKDETVSLTTMSGRLHVPLHIGAYQRDALKGKRPTAATVCRKGRTGWFIHIVVEEPDPPPVDGPPMGVDLGIRNTAATSNGTLHDGSGRQTFKAKMARTRASLQSKGTRGTKHVLCRLSGYENRRIRHENHELSKSLVAEAERHNCGTIRMERLKGIRQRTKKWNKHLNRMMSGWSFGELQSFVSYKAARKGIQAEFVEPAFTSQVCSQCGQLGLRKGDEFHCPTCGMFHADINAARNIAAGGVACRPARIDDCVLHNQSKAVAFRRR